MVGVLLGSALNYNTLTFDNCLLTSSSSFTRSFSVFFAALIFLKLSRSFWHSSFSAGFDLEVDISLPVGVDGVDTDTGISSSTISLGKISFEN